MIKRLFVADTHGFYPELSGFPDHDIILMGDMMEHGSVMEYRRFDKWIDSQCYRPNWERGGDIFLVRGNHDSGQYGNLLNPSAIKAWDDLAIENMANIEDDTIRYPYVITSDQDTLIILDSICKTHSPHDFAQGLVGDNQMTKLDVTLGESRDYRHYTTVLLHHDPFNADTTLLLKDAGQFIVTVSGRADYVFYGHVHLNPEKDVMHRTVSGTNFYACPALQEAGGQTWEQVIHDDGSVEINLVTV